MANAGKLVKNDEVTAFINTIDEFKVREAVIVKAVERILDNTLDRILGQTVYTDEEYDIKLELSWDGIVQRPANKFVLKQFPITDFESLEIVTDRDTTTGLPISTTVLTKNEYHVNLNNGIVSVFETTFASSDRVFPSFINPNSLESFPAGTARLLATYTAGYTEATVPDDLKFLIFQMVSRLHRLVKSSELAVSAIQSDFGVTTLLRTMFTPEELVILKSHKRPALA